MIGKSLWILFFMSSLEPCRVHGLRNFEPYEMAMHVFEVPIPQQTSFEGRSGYADSSYAVPANRHEQQRRPVSGWTAFTPAWLHDHEVPHQDSLLPTTVAPRVVSQPYKGQASYHAPGLEDLSHWNRHESRNQGFEKEEAVPVQVNPVLTKHWHQEEDWRQKTFFQPEQFQENAGTSRPSSFPATRTQAKPQVEGSRYDTQRPQSPQNQNNYHDYAETPQQQFYNPGPPPPYYPAKATKGKSPEVAYNPPRQPAPILREKVPVTPRPSPPAQAPPRTYPPNTNVFPNQHVPNLNSNSNNAKHKFAQEPTPYHQTQQRKPNLGTNRQKPEYYPNSPPTPKNPSEYPKYPVGPERQPAPPSDFAEDPYKDMISLKRQNRPTPPRTTTTEAPPRVVTPDPYKDLIVYKRKPATRPPLPSYDESLDYQAPYIEPYNDVPAAPEADFHPYSPSVPDEESDSYAPLIPTQDTRPYAAPEPAQDPYPYSSPPLEEQSELEAPLDVVEEPDDEGWPLQKPYEKPQIPTVEDTLLPLYGLSGPPPVSYPTQPVVKESSKSVDSPDRYPNSSFHTDEADDETDAEVPFPDDIDAMKFKPTTFRPSTTTAPILTTKASTAPSLTRSRLKTRLPSTNTRTGQGTQSVKVDVDLPAKSKTGSTATGQDKVLLPVLKDIEHPQETTQSTQRSIESTTAAPVTTAKILKATKADTSGGRIAAYRQRLEQLREQANKNRDLSKTGDSKAENDIQSSSPKNAQVTRGTTTTTSTTRRPTVSRTRPRFPTRNRLGDDDQRGIPGKEVQEEEKPVARKQPSATEAPTTSTRRTFTPRSRSTTTTTTEPYSPEEPVKEAPSGEDSDSEAPFKQRNRPYRRKPGLRRRIPSTTTESALVLEEEEEEKKEEAGKEFKVTPWKRSSTSTSPATSTTTEIPDMSHEREENKKEDDEQPEVEFIATSTLRTTSTTTSSTTVITTSSASTSTTPEATSISVSSSTPWINTPRTFGVEPWVGQSVDYESQALDIPGAAIFKPENMIEAESSLSMPKLISYPKFSADKVEEIDEPVIELVEEIPAGVSSTERTETGDLENQESLKDILSKWRLSTSTTTEQIGQPWLQYTEHLFDAPSSSENSQNSDSVELLERSDDEDTVSGAVVTSTTTTATTGKHNWQFPGPSQAPFLPIEQLLPVRRSTKKSKNRTTTPPSE